MVERTEGFRADCQLLAGTMTDILGDVLGAAHTNPTAEHLYVDVNEVGVESWRRCAVGLGWRAMRCDVSQLTTSSKHHHIVHRKQQKLPLSTNSSTHQLFRMWIFEVYEFHSIHRKGGLPIHILTADSPSNQSTLAIELTPNPHEYNLLAQLDRRNELRVLYNLSVWCGDAQVFSVENREAEVGAGTWLELGTLDLRDSLEGIHERIQSTHLRVILNIRVLHETILRLIPVDNPQDAERNIGVLRHDSNAGDRYLSDPPVAVDLLTREERRKRHYSKVTSMLFYFFAGFVFESMCCENCCPVASGGHLYGTPCLLTPLSFK